MTHDASPDPLVAALIEVDGPGYWAPGDAEDYAASLRAALAQPEPLHVEAIADALYELHRLPDYAAMTNRDEAEWLAARLSETREG